MGLLWPSFAEAQEDFIGKTITSVVIRYRGVKTVDESRIRNHMSVKAGQKFDPDALDGDIKKLYESGLVNDVRFLAEPQGSGIKLITEVATRPGRGGIGFAGNTVFSDKKLASETKLKPGGGAWTDAEILSARRNLETLYQGYGYPTIMITHRLQVSTDNPGVADLVFDIDEGSKSEVRKIRFEGNEAFSDVELRREMKTKQKGLFSWITKSGRIDPARLDEDLQRVMDFYRNNGYLRVSIDGVRRAPVKHGRVDLVIPVNEGGLYNVQSVGFGKMTVFTSEELYPSLSLTAGQPYSLKKMRDDIRMVRSYYGSRGYADATVFPEIKDAGPGLVSIGYRIKEGRRYRVGRVNIEGNTKTQDRVVRREVPMKPGEYFSSVNVETTKKRLQNLNYFDQVQVSGAASAQAGYRDVNILLSEKKTGSISFGAGFSSIDNIVGYVNLEQSNFDITNPWNFTGGGQRFAMQMRLGSERRDFKVSLTEPWFLGKELALGGELYFRDLAFLNDNYEQGSVGGAIFLRKRLGRKGYIKGEYRLENIDVDVDTIPWVDYTGPGGIPDGVPDPSLFTMEDGRYLRSAIALTYVYDSRDSNITPRQGGRAKMGVTFTGGALGGDVDTYTVAASGSKHWNLPGDMILNLSGAAAVVDSHGGGTVPIFERQFLGGSRNLRGFEYRDVGPRDPVTGDAIGGKTSAYATAELTFHIFENIRGAAFVDAGMVSADEWDFGFGDLYSDAGMGLRLNLPFGPLALDYAIPIQSGDPLADKGGQFNFYLNYQF